MRFLLRFIVVLSLASCGTAIQTPSPTNSTDIIATTGVFTVTDEAVSASRFADMVQRFQSGQETTKFDTELMFGQELVAAPLPRGTSQDLQPEIITQLTQYAKNNASYNFLIYEKGRVVAESYFGETTSQSLLNAKSLAKPLGVIAIGRAVQKGNIDLDQSASDFIIEWKGTDKEAIKIRHLLDMRSGLLPQGFDPNPEHVLNRALLHPRHNEVLIHDYPLVHVPGSQYEYSNANSELVGVIIERATGVSYQTWLSREVLMPLGATGGRISMNRDGGMAHSGCCLSLTSETYLKLGVLILQGGLWNGEQLLSAEYVNQMLTSTPQNKYAGMGIYLGQHYKKDRGYGNPNVKSFFPGTLHSEAYIDKDIALFDGNGNQVIYIMPSRNMVIMRLGKIPRNTSPWDNAYLPNTISRHIDSR